LLFNVGIESSFSRIHYLLDSETGEYHEVLSAELLNITPDDIFMYPAIGPDDRTIYFERLRVEADIWMLTLNDTK
jgi:hypothetical protein